LFDPFVVKYSEKTAPVFSKLKAISRLDFLIESLHTLIFPVSSSTSPSHSTHYAFNAEPLSHFGRAENVCAHHRSTSAVSPRQRAHLRCWAEPISRPHRFV